MRRRELKPMQNKPVYIDVAQGSVDWLALRAGVPSASNFGKIVTSKGEPSKQSDKYLYQLVGEKLLGAPTETYQNDAMIRGQELEPEAREAYEFITDNKVEEVGFCYYDDNKLIGASPDGIIGEDGGLEIKCPSLPVHVEYLDKGKLPVIYLQQVQGCMLVTGRSYWDFFSYFPGLPPLLIRVERDEKFLGRLKPALDEFCEKLDDMTTRLKNE